MNEQFVNFISDDNSARIEFAKIFACRLQDITFFSREKKACESFVSNLIRECNFPATMLALAEQGQNSAILLSYTPDTFVGRDMNCGIWEIMPSNPDLVYQYDHGENISCFIKRKPFLEALCHFFPEPFVPIIRNGTIEIKW